MKHEDLFLLRGIFCSDNDGNPAEEIYAGYDEEYNLKVVIEHTDCDFPENNCRTCAVIQREDAYRLAKRLGVTMTRLPQAVADSVDDGCYELINPTLGETRACFSEILEWLATEGCRFRLARTFGRYEYCCF